MERLKELPGWKQLKYYTLPVVRRQIKLEDHEPKASELEWLSENEHWKLTQNAAWHTEFKLEPFTPEARKVFYEDYDRPIKGDLDFCLYVFKRLNERTP